MEFSDKRVREVMTPRPDIVAIAAEATLEELHAKFVEKKFSKMPVYENSLDDIFGVVHAQDLLHIADQDLPETKSTRASAPRALHAGDKSRIGTAARDAAEGPTARRDHR